MKFTIYLCLFLYNLVHGDFRQAHNAIVFVVIRWLFVCWEVSDDSQVLCLNRGSEPLSTVFFDAVAQGVRRCQQGAGEWEAGGRTNTAVLEPLLYRYLTPHLSMEEGTVIL